jgi:deoxycytidine triphosphate deaminase
MTAKSDEVCETSYKDRGKYQGRQGVTLPKI